MTIKMGVRERTHAAFIIYGILGYLFLYVPVILLAALSFNQSRAGNLPFTGLTLDWYRELFRDYLVIDAFKNSLFVATVTALLATIIGTSAVPDRKSSSWVLNKSFSSPGKCPVP